MDFGMDPSQINFSQLNLSLMDPDHLQAMIE
jgi:hypothetical protein